MLVNGAPVECNKHIVGQAGQHPFLRKKKTIHLKSVQKYDNLKQRAKLICH